MVEQKQNELFGGMWPAEIPKKKDMKKPRKTHEFTDSMLALHRKAYRARLGEDLVVNWGRDKKLLSKLLETRGSERVIELNVKFFQLDTGRDAFYARDFSIQAFYSAFGELTKRFPAKTTGKYDHLTER